MKDVHTAHCCAKCGCKYGKDDECTVATGKAPAQYGCEFCEEELDYIKQNIPEGYALVPVEPNSRQLEAGKNAIDANGGEGDDSALLSDALEAYRAMIAAATETNVACDLCKGSGKKVVGPDQDGRKYKVDCDCTKP